MLLCNIQKEDVFWYFDNFITNFIFVFSYKNSKFQSSIIRLVGKQYWWSFAIFIFSLYIGYTISPMYHLVSITLIKYSPRILFTLRFPFSIYWNGFITLQNFHNANITFLWTIYLLSISSSCTQKAISENMDFCPISHVSHHIHLVMLHLLHWFWYENRSDKCLIK